MIPWNYKSNSKLILYFKYCIILHYPFIFIQRSIIYHRQFYFSFFFSLFNNLFLYSKISRFISQKFYQFKNHFYTLAQNHQYPILDLCQDLRTSRYRAFVDETRRSIVRKGWEEYVYTYMYRLRGRLFVIVSNGQGFSYTQKPVKRVTDRRKHRE